jgi:hypothetical protein
VERPQRASARTNDVYARKDWRTLAGTGKGWCGQAGAGCAGKQLAVTFSMVLRAWEDRLSDPRDLSPLARIEREFGVHLPARYWNGLAAAGVGIAVLVMLLAGLFARQKATTQP